MHPYKFTDHPKGKKWRENVGEFCKKIWTSHSHQKIRPTTSLVNTTIRPWSWCATIPSILEKETLRTIWYTNIAGWNIPIFNRKYIFKRSIFHCHVSLPECIPFSCQCQTPMKISTRCKIQMLKRTLIETCNRHVAIYKRECSASIYKPTQKGTLRMAQKLSFLSMDKKK